MLILILKVDNDKGKKLTDKWSFPFFMCLFHAFYSYQNMLCSAGPDNLNSGGAWLVAAEVYGLHMDFSVSFCLLLFLKGY
jgi:hypothetical protein